MMTDEKIVACMIVLLVMYVLTIGFIAADLWAGVRKAKLLGVLRTSEGYKRTIEKLAKYGNALMALSVMDGVQLAIVVCLYKFYGWDGLPMLPWFTTLGTAYIGFVEVKSILEPASDKERRQMKQVTALAVELAKHRTEPEEIAKAIVDYINSEEKK